MTERPLHWTDVHEIVIALEARHPRVDVANLRFVDLHRFVVELPGFADDPLRSNEKLLEALQMAWIDERE